MNDESKLEAIRTAVLAGEESGVADGDVMGEIRQRMRRRARGMGTQGQSADSPPPENQFFEDS